MKTTSLKDRVCVVTGSGRGIGFAIAKRFAAEGAHIVINDVNAAQAEESAREVAQLGVKTWADSHDISDHAAAGEMAAKVKEKFGRIDVVVNNAGILRDSLLTQLSEKDWDDVIRVNLKGPYNVGQACAKLMGENQSGSIINISSVAHLGNVGQTNYSAAKAGVVGMTRTWALELARYGIRVNAIAPGMIETAMTESVPEKIMERFIRKIPLGRLGSPQEIAEAAAFLASDRSSYLTGQVLIVDGGLSVGL